jgi:hypothetical protein
MAVAAAATRNDTQSFISLSSATRNPNEEIQLDDTRARNSGTYGNYLVLRSGKRPARPFEGKRDKIVRETVLCQYSPFR